MPEFKVGDRVRYTGSVELDSKQAGHGAVIKVKPSSYMISWDDLSTTTEVLEDLEPELASRNDPPLEDWEKALLQTPFEQNVRRILEGVADTVVQKNLAYGDSALNPIRLFSKTDRMEQLFVRLDDKLSRVQKGHEYPGDDTIRDIIGYCTLVLIARESE